MSTQSTKSTTQEDLPQEEEEEETKQNPQEQSKEDTKVATSLPPSSSSSAEKESSPSNATMIPLQEAALLLLADFGILSDSDGEKEDTSPQETNKHSSTSVSTSPDSATPSKRPFNDTGNDEDESQGKEKKKKEELHGGDTKDTKPKEVKPLEPYLVRLSSDVETEISLLRGILDYHLKNSVYPFENSLSLQEFMTDDWLGVDVLESDLLEEIEKLKKKYEKVAEQIGSNLNALEPRNHLAFNLAHTIWGTQSETESVLDVEPLTVLKMEEKPHGDGESSGKDQKEMSIIEAEIIFLNGLVLYNFKNGRYPFDNDNDMDDFIKNWVLLPDFPVGKFMAMIEDLRRKYDKKGKTLKNVGSLGPSDRDAFDLAKKVWGNRIGN